MSFDPHQPPSYGPYPPPPPPYGAPLRPRQGMSTAAKVLIILGIVFGGLMLLCCSGLFLAGWWVGQGVSEDPAIIARVTNEMVQMEIPEELKPTLSMDLTIPFTAQRLRLVAHTDPDDESALILVATGRQVDPADREAMREQIERSLRRQAIERQEPITQQQSYRKQLQIHGQEVTFQIVTGTGARSKTPRIEVLGVFPGKRGPVMLIFNGTAERYSLRRVIEMLESIDGAQPLPPEEQPPPKAEKEPAPAVAI